MSPLPAARLATHDSDGRDVVVCGCRVGDPAEALRATAWERGEPRGAFVFHSGGAVSRRRDDGALEAVPLDEIVALVVRDGGRLGTGGVAVEVEGGRVTAVFLRGAALAPLTVSAERDVEPLFGPAAGVERRYGRVTFQYPQRALRVVVDAATGGLDALILGESEWRPRVFTAQDLIDQFLEVDDQLEPLQWRVPDDAAPSFRVRCARLAALLRAFGIVDAAAFAAGTFVVDVDAALIARAFPQAEQPLDRASTRANVVDWAFRSLLDYRRGAKQLLRHNAGWIECSSHVLLESIAMTERANAALRPALVELDRALCTLIDRQGRSFTLRELVALGYPDVDLEQLDADEF